MSTIPGYTERMVFLAPLAWEAMWFAKAMSKRIGGVPLLLSVKLRPADPLRVSDDYILHVVLHAIMEAEGHPPLSAVDFDEDGDLNVPYSEAAGFYRQWHELLFCHRDEFFSGKLEAIARSDELPDLLPEEYDQRRLLATLRAGYVAYRKALHVPWQASAGRNQRDPAVGFEGVIPPDRIKVVDAEGTEEARRSLAWCSRSTQIFSMRHGDGGSSETSMPHVEERGYVFQRAHLSTAIGCD